jgi:hypothetical protein
MERFNQLESELLVEAANLWSGRGRSSWPDPDDSVVIERFGAELGATLLSKLKDWRNQFYESDANFVAANLAEMGTLAARQFSTRHPEVPEAVVEVFAWCYTYDYK